jgi:uncharacterized protein
MRLDVSHLLKAPIGARDVMHLELGPATLDEDLDISYLRGDISLTRTTDGLLVEGQLETALDVECVRCLALFSLPLKLQVDDLVFALPQTPSHVSEYRISEQGWINAARAFREQIVLHIPFNSVCRPECKGLCSQCGQDLNEGTCDCEQQAIDPRLAVLRDLL